MKLRLPQMGMLLCLLVVLSEPSYSQSLTSITESDIQAMLDGMDKAIRKRNVAGMIAPFASDIKIKMTLLNPRNNRELEATINKEQYASNARKILGRKLAYHFERMNTRIKIYDAQTAMVTSEVHDTLRLKEGTIRGASSEVYYVSLRDGKLVITAVEIRTRLE